jgi:adenosylhomocysteine nucleosidase
LKRLGIVVAMKAEARTLAKQPIAEGERVLLSGGAVLLLSGIGSARASTAARALLEAGATALLSWGSAGGLRSELSPGSLSLPSMIIAADRSAYPSDPAWHARLCSRLKGHIALYTGPLAGSATILRTAEEKVELYRQTGAFAVDMESGSVAAAARTAGVPFAAIRAIADSAETEVPRATLQAFDEYGQLNLRELFKGLTRHPTEILALARLGIHFRMAQTTLTKVARRIEGDWALP